MFDQILINLLVYSNDRLANLLLVEKLIITSPQKPRRSPYHTAPPFSPTPRRREDSKWRQIGVFEEDTKSEENQLTIKSD